MQTASHQQTTPRMKYTKCIKSTDGTKIVKCIQHHIIRRHWMCEMQIVSYIQTALILLNANCILSTNSTKSVKCKLHQSTEGKNTVKCKLQQIHTESYQRTTLKFWNAYSITSSGGTEFWNANCITSSGSTNTVKC